METTTPKNTKTVFKAIFAWQDEKEEHWLEEMAAKGWHLKEVAPYFYSFLRGTPEKVAYRMDYKNTLDKDYGEYSTIFHDSGWELVSRMSNWHYYRINRENTNAPEIYNSARAKAQKYRRLLMGLTPLMIIFVVVFNPAFRLFNHSEETGWISDLYGITMVIQAFVCILFVYAFIRILIKIRKLESESRE